ncbi:MAG: hypothetical protein Q8Q12_13055, partial [bacterium]|nr:hypothetical protein [bacterium]
MIGGARVADRRDPQCKRRHAATGLRNRKICRVGERRERGDFIYGPRLLCGGNEGFDLSVRVIEVTIPK